MAKLKAVKNGKSCYILELSVQPGGARWAELHAYTDAGHIRLCLERWCRDEERMPAYLSIVYGATLMIWVVERGVVTAGIDLHDHIRASFDGKSAPLSDEAALEPVRARAEADDATGEMPLAGVTLSLLWDDIEVKLPSLVAPLLEPGAATRIDRSAVRRDDTYLDAEGIIRFGSFEVENGDMLDPPVPI